MTPAGDEQLTNDLNQRAEEALLGRAARSAMCGALALGADPCIPGDQFINAHGFFDTALAIEPRGSPD